MPNTADHILQAIYDHIAASLLPLVVHSSYCNIAVRSIIIHQAKFWLETFDDQSITICRLGMPNYVLHPTLELHIADPQLCEKLIAYIHAHL